MNDPVAITGTVYSALCWPSAKGFAYIVSLIITPPGGQRKQQRLGAVMQQRAPSHPANGLQSQSLHPSPQCRGWRLSLQDFSVTKTSSPLITDFITHEAAGLGRRKIAWLLRPMPVQKEGTERAFCQPVWPTCYFHLSDFWLWAASPACLQPGQQDQSGHEPNRYSWIGQNQSWAESELMQSY